MYDEGEDLIEVAYDEGWDACKDVHPDCPYSEISDPDSYEEWWNGFFDHMDLLLKPKDR